MIKIKTPEQIALMGKSGEILAYAKNKVFMALKPGVTTQEIDLIARKAILSQGAKPAFKNYSGFPGNICISINDQLIHGIASQRVIKTGDIVKIDMGAIWKGWYSDSAFTKGIGQISKIDQKLISVAKDAFYVGLKAIKKGARVGDISYAIGQFVKSKGFFVPHQYTGHGIGTNLHEDPHVPNWGNKKTGPLLKNGMVIAIEPMILQNSPHVRVLDDNWTVVSSDGSNTAHYEHTVAIIDNQGVILTGGI